MTPETGMEGEPQPPLGTPAPSRPRARAATSSRGMQTNKGLMSMEGEETGGGREVQSQRKLACRGGEWGERGEWRKHIGEKRKQKRGRKRRGEATGEKDALWHVPDCGNLVNGCTLHKFTPQRPHSRFLFSTCIQLCAFPPFSATLITWITIILQVAKTPLEINHYNTEGKNKQTDKHMYMCAWINTI